ncbi:MAG TPA: carbonic anhydrase [Bryobacteraceae bacterium]|nr:carbonic anhydrase [Bryobacteraceae bacterium]
MQKLIEGIHEFQREDFKPLEGLFGQLAHGQDPETLFITCSDSRIDPNLLTRSMPGDLFILRNAGNIIPSHGAGNGGEAATIEYAVTVLGVKDIIVCGHSHCGAMKALLHPEKLTNLPSVASWLSHAETTRRIVLENYSHLGEEELLDVTIEENVLVQIEHLETLPSIASRKRRGNINLWGWVYKIETGQVFAYDVKSKQFISIAEYEIPVPEEVRKRRTSAI